MTPSQLETMARQQYNAVGDTLWSTAEIMDLIYAACMELALESWCIEQTFLAPTVVGTSEYDFPGNSIGIKRITYDGRRLNKITFRQDDYLTGGNQNSTTQGTPNAYAEWNETFYLRPIPDAVYNLKVFAFIEPQPVTSTSVLEVPSRYHLYMVDYLLYRMYAKDKDFNSAQFFENKWEKNKGKAVSQEKRKRRADAFAVVQEDECIDEALI